MIRTARALAGALCTVCALCALAAPARAAGPARPLRLLSLTGAARVDGEATVAPSRWPAGALLDLSCGAVAQLLVETPAGALALAVRGPARVRLLGRAAEVDVLEGRALRLAGAGALQAAGWRLELDGTALLDGERLFVLEGRASLRPLPGGAVGPVLRFARAIADEPGLAAGVQPTAGHAVRLGLTRAELTPGAPPEPLLAELSRFQPPPAWRSRPPEVTLAEVRRAEQWTREQRRSERQAASCGCTESRGPGGAPVLGSGPGVNPLERSGSLLRLRVVGIPRIPQ